MHKQVDVHSDTVTKPDQKKRQSMMNVPVYGADPSVNVVREKQQSVSGMRLVRSGAQGRC